MGAETATEPVGPTSNAYRVTCSQHGLNRLVMTPEHAANIVRLHDRTDHAEDPPPESFDISAAARVALDLHSFDGADNGMMVFAALVGRPDADNGELLQLARDYADSPTTAHSAPF